MSKHTASKPKRIYISLFGKRFIFETEKVQVRLFGKTRTLRNIEYIGFYDPNLDKVV